MKNLKFLAFLGLLSSCDLVDTMPTQDVLDQTNTISSSAPVNSATGLNASSPTGNWSIHLLIEDGFDITRNFQGFTFKFSNSGTLEAAKSSSVFTGRWRIERDFPSDEFYLDFPAGTILEELDDDWYVVEKTDHLLVLEERDGALVDRLVFVNDKASVSIDSPFTKEKAKGDALFEKVINAHFGIKSFVEDNRERSGLFQGVELATLPMGRVELKRANQVIAVGIWQVGFNDREIRLELDFESEGLADYLDEEWQLVTKTAQTIRLMEIDDFQSDTLELMVK